jgi:hypothetical protein
MIHDCYYLHKNFGQDATKGEILRIKKIKLIHAYFKILISKKKFVSGQRATNIIHLIFDELPYLRGLIG